MNEKYPFETGGRYRTRGGDYIVVAIHGDTLTVHFDDGREQTLNIDVQSRIWRNILDDELAVVRRSDFTKKDLSPNERLVTWPVRLLVADVLRAEFAPPYPPVLPDQVCLAIEANPEWLRRYHALAAELGEPGEPADWKVNNAIGSWMQDLTGMVNDKEGVAAANGLMKSYSRLRYAG